MSAEGGHTFADHSRRTYSSKIVAALTTILSALFTVIAVATLVGAIVGALWVVPSYFEAKSFNRLTGAHATTWDAMWVELRVQEGAKR